MNIERPPHLGCRGVAAQPALLGNAYSCMHILTFLRICFTHVHTQKLYRENLESI